MKNTVVCTILLGALACSPKKEFKGNVVTGKERADTPSDSDLGDTFEESDPDITSLPGSETVIVSQTKPLKPKPKPVPTNSEVIIENTAKPKLLDGSQEFA